MPGKEISINKRYDAYKYLKTGYGLRETARLLNMSAYGARYNEQRIDDTAVLTNRTYSDRCILLSPAVTFIDELLQNRPTISKKQLQQQLKTKGFTLTIRQIRYRIQLLGYHWKKVKKCQVIRAENQILRCELHQWMTTFATFCFFVFITVVGTEIIVEVENGIFVQHSSTTVSIYERKDMETQTFRLMATAFEIPYPDMINKVQDQKVRADIGKMVNESLDFDNQDIFSHLKDICFDEPSLRVKRVDPITVGFVVGGVVIGTALGVGGFYILKYGADISNLQAELAATKDNLKEAITMLNNATKMLENQKFSLDITWSLSDYLRKQKSIIVQFIKLVKEKKTLQLSELPVNFRRYFENATSADSFYFLQLLGCSEEGMNIQINVMQTSKSRELQCHTYSHAGKFQHGIYLNYVLPDLICYYDDICYTVDVDQCLNRFNKLKCPSSALQKCRCDPHNLQYTIKSEYTHRNFLKVHEYGNLVLLASTAKTYTIIKNGLRSTHLLPPSGIVYLQLNENDRIELASVIIHGQSKNYTEIAHIVSDSYTLPPHPHYSTMSYKEEIGKGVTHKGTFSDVNLRFRWHYVDSIVPIYV